jgi:LPXTG-site transpeptidase (sortase) family protein
MLAAIIWYAPLLMSLLKPQLIQARVTSLTLQPSPLALTPEFRYDTLGITAPLVQLTQTNPLDYQDWNKLRQALRDGVGLTHTTQDFDQAHLAYIVGPSSDYYPHKFASIFAGLGQAKQGDIFTLTVYNKTYSFAVQDKKIVDQMDTKAFTKLEDVPTNTQRVVLVTCWPVLTTKNRLLIIGERKL